MTTGEKQVLAARWKGRTDLLWLCREVIGFKDVTELLHGSLINRLQRFPLPPDFETAIRSDSFQHGHLRYQPWMDMYKLPGKRRRLILAFRGSLKTSISDIAHTIQWLLNFPDAAIMLMQATVEKAQEILLGCKDILQGNPVFREIYPDYCPKGRIKEFGTRDRFTLPNRINTGRPAPSVLTASVDKGLAGYHFDIMKFSDIVEETNTRTKAQMDQVWRVFSMSQNLLVSPAYGWIDIDGTRYHFEDTYGRIIEAERTSTADERLWEIYCRPVFKKKLPPGKIEHDFTLDELSYPYEYDGNDKRVSWWPERFPIEFLDKMQRQDEYMFAGQYLLDPAEVSEELIPFPPRYATWFTLDQFRQIKPVFFSTTVDTGETTKDASDFSVITTCAWDGAGRCYVLDIRRGHFLPDELIDNLLEAHSIYNPLTVKIEETSYVRGLKTTITREAERRNVQINLDFIKRDNQVSKQERILLTLQPWYKSGQIRFFAFLRDRDQLLNELKSFPKGRDDILDTLADQFQNREHFGRLRIREPEPKEIMQTAFQRWIMPEPFDTEDTGSNYDPRPSGL